MVRARVVRVDDGDKMRLPCVIRKLIAAAAVSLIAMTSLASTASGSPSPNGHYYAIARWDTTCCVTGEATLMSISPSPYAADAASGGFIEQTLWQLTANSSAYWVEAGWTEGWQGSAGRYWYWADNRPTHGYFEHQIGWAGPDNATHTVQLAQAPLDQYYVFIDSTRFGISVSNPPGTQISETGVESTNPASHLGVTSSNNLQYRDGANAWVNNWSGAYVPPVNSRAYGSWQFTSVKFVDGMN